MTVVSALPTITGYKECYKVYIHTHPRWCLIWSKPIADWTVEDHKAEVLKRMRPHETIVVSKNRWEKYLECKVGVGKAIFDMLKEEPEIEESEDTKIREEREAERVDMAVCKFEEKWKDAPLSNVYKLWMFMEASRKSAAGIAPSNAGRKKRLAQDDEGEPEKKKLKPGRPSGASKK
jgi:hypothetical protein